MVDNIQFNKISPLLSSTEQVIRVDRRPRDSQNPPFNGNQQDKKKKKKKKHPEQGATRSEVTSAKQPSRQSGLAAAHQPDKETNLEDGLGKRIIDIRV